MVKKNKTKHANTSLKKVEKAAKLKSKAKPVNSQLKRINIKNKEKVLEIDKQLVELQDKIRGTATKNESKKQQTTNVKMKSFKKESEKDYIKQNQASQETLNQLDQMQL